MFRHRNAADALSVLATKAISANIMIADDKLNIVYVNEAVMALLRQAEADIKKDLRQFSVDRLIGTNIDVFHKDPSHQRQMLQSLKSVHRATIKMGKWSFDLVATPLQHADGSRAGTVVEWADASIRLQNLNYAAQAAAVSRAQA
ncbi:MAG: PAS domain-containing protein, partial [Planctomycetes bacterium]|nr:PAS domain-containing protein [Planctomycetota bacterium]